MDSKEGVGTNVETASLAGEFEVLLPGVVMSGLESRAKADSRKVAKMPIENGRILVVAIPNDGDTSTFVRAALGLARNEAEGGHFSVDTGENNGR